MRVAIGILLVLMHNSAAGMEPRDLQGLSLTVEPVGESLVVDGVAMRIQHVRGADVPLLARRIADRWRAGGDAPRPLQQRGWQMLARFSGGESELIQWRGEGSAAELIYSRLDAKQPPRRTVAAPFHLPSRCAWGRGVQSTEQGALHVQRTAACRGTAREIRPLLRSALQSAGWQLRESAGGAFELQRGAVSGRLLSGDDDHGDGSVLVWLGTHAVVRAGE